MIDNNDVARFAAEMVDHCLLSSEALDGVIGWIRANLSPEDVFFDEALERWATEYGFRREDD